MKRSKLIKYLTKNGCILLREGGKHSWWFNPSLKCRSAVPRHTEIVDLLVNKICKDLGIPKIK
ncbi:MAG: type II toxin-antitoxin system HicA family toxin [Spirochaetales bacterium]|nr:type II toxin-antitoxin system HicA family toxin [Spirochaetales bacterium]